MYLERNRIGDGRVRGSVRGRLYQNLLGHVFRFCTWPKGNEAGLENFCGHRTDRAAAAAETTADTNTDADTDTDTFEKFYPQNKSHKIETCGPTSSVSPLIFFFCSSNPPFPPGGRPLTPSAAPCPAFLGCQLRMAYG